MIDSHAHIDTKAFHADLPDTLQRAWDAGIEAIIVPDIEPSRREHLREVVDRDARLFRGIGIHPHHVGDVASDALRVVEEDSHQEGIVAIGEIGLDYHYDFCPADVQKSYFREQIRIAKRRGLPIIVHNRESDQDVLDIIEDEQDGTLQGVLHCFSGGLDILERAMKIGMHVSFTGNITFKRSTLDDVIRAVPEDRFMIETDSPYITPEPHRGTRNEPAHVAFVAQKIAEIRNMSLTDVKTITTRTARKLFALSLALITLTLASVAQPKPPVDEDYPNDRDWEIALDNYYADSVAYQKWIKPRRLGFGISLGSNTTVELQQYLQRYDPDPNAYGGDITDARRWVFYERDKGPDRSFSFEGLLAIGATVTYGLTTQLVLEATYFYSENTEPAKQFGLDPTTLNLPLSTTSIRIARSTSTRRSVERSPSSTMGKRRVRSSASMEGWASV
jgi:TatD DNase family protein